MVKKKLQINSFNDAGSVIVSPETVSVTTWYTLTINPEIQLFGDPDRFMLVSSYVYGALKKINHITCQLYPEISGKGRIHFHGRIRIHDITDFFIYGVYKLFNIGHIEIDTISDSEVWEKYITKSKSYMEDLLKGNPIYLNGNMSIFDTIG